MTNMDCQRKLFDLPDDITYFNMAYQSPLLKSSVAAGETGLRRKLRPHTITKDDFFQPLEEVKNLFAQLIDCRDPQRIAYIPSVSYGIATVVNNLDPRTKGNIVLVAEQFPSNALSYISFCEKHHIELRTVAPSENLQGRGPRWNQDLLNAIDEHTICVSLPHCHWSDGSIFDLKSIRLRTKLFDSLLIVDGTQSIGAMPFSIAEIQPDALIVATYKYLLGPYGSALAYYGPYFDDKIPIEHSWMNRTDSDQFHRLSDYSPTFRPKAYRYNVGECANFITLPMLADCLRQLLDWQVASIEGYCRSIFDGFSQKLQERGFDIAQQRDHGAHLFGVGLPEGWSIESKVQELLQENIYISRRGSYLRIAPHIYNDPTDVAKLTSALLSNTSF